MPPKPPPPPPIRSLHELVRTEAHGTASPDDPVHWERSLRARVAEIVSYSNAGEPAIVDALIGDLVESTSLHVRAEALKTIRGEVESLDTDNVEDEIKDIAKLAKLVDGLRSALQKAHRMSDDGLPKDLVDAWNALEDDIADGKDAFADAARTTTIEAMLASAKKIEEAAKALDT